MPTWFVTATGTAIGKTTVAAILCYQIRRRGHAVRALKPVLSGYQPDAAASSDAGLLLRSADRPVDATAVAEIAPWRFRAPLSPDMAAAREGRRLPIAELIDFCRGAAPRPSSTDLLLIEGIGGVMVPLDEKHTVLDWIAALDARVLLVTGSYLGTLSHTLCAWEVLRGRGCTPAALVVSESPESPVPPAETAAVLRRFAPRTPLGLLPRLPDSDEFWRHAPDLAFLLDAPA